MRRFNSKGDKSQPNFGNFAGSCARKWSRHGSSIGCSEERAFVTQRLQGFLHWGTTHVKLLGQVRFQQPVARFVEAIHNGASNLVDDDLWGPRLLVDPRNNTNPIDQRGF
jgi:hypothetical protein